MRAVCFGLLTATLFQSSTALAQDFPAPEVIARLHSTSKEAMRSDLFCDLARLKLSVTNVEAREEVSGLFSQLTAPEEWDLIVATLAGIAQEPCRLVVGTNEFSARLTRRYEEGVIVAITRASAGVKKDDGYWDIAPPAEPSSADNFIQEPGPVEIQVVWLVPRSAETFEVRMPATAGEAVDLSVIRDR